jgi:UDP-N-acetylglucosamine--N-acetylmuramyl-(pentapeptide) pyrophosphoryl-undecaprenol N-acetylglucosamine transferase
LSTLLVASTGGHLAQLVRLERRLRGELDDELWVTFDTPQSRSLLAGREVVFARHTYSRDWRSVASNSLLATRLLRERQVTGVVSTGAGIALSFIPPARVSGRQCHFIESAARSDGPSLTGKLLGRLPGVRLYSQYPGWAGGRWRYAGSVFDEFRPIPASSASGTVRRVVVTLGTIGKYGFRRLLERLIDLLPPEAEVLWQTDVSDTAGLPIQAHRVLPPEELQRAMRDADVVVAHAGIGSALAALEAGRCPVLVPRQKSHGEHVDDHQQQIAGELDRRGLAIARQVEDLRSTDLAAAASRRVETLQDPPPVLLDR